MTSEPLFRERLRFWLSAVRYYQARNQHHGMVKVSNEIAYERAKDDLLRVAERVKSAPPPLPEPEPTPRYRHRCPACGILQAGREVCAECVALYGSAVAALAAARGRKEHDLQDTSSRFPVAPLSRLVVEEAITARRELCARMRDLLARHKRVHLSTTATLLGIGYHTARAVLGDIMAGSDGQPPIKVKMVREGRIIYWEVGE